MTPDPRYFIEQCRFTCPSCGGWKYGSTRIAGQLIGACHTGECQFTWNREDDKLYFTGTGEFIPRFLGGRKRVAEAGDVFADANAELLTRLAKPGNKP